MPDRTRSWAVPLPVSGWPTRTHSRWTSLGSGSLTTFVDPGRCRGGEAGLLSGLTSLGSKTSHFNRSADSPGSLA